ncbi:hypothetical protein [Allomuricauda sp. SCSIO 65647]|uniref:hypothetical protein n=1 Tax=Allomuricauda sp. SCSIO 65647 TaxID=2908843 RepID=UPI001F404A93|nr:hypothetical protein [Muricauda sp. SCSIO 65647]UJH68113.1 hypothetical protein L0P89_02610 [Muricauda sp. SCSIO 65647]
MQKTLLVVVLLFATLLNAQRDWSSVTITSERLSENIYVLFGAGGNIGLAVGEENVF